MRFPNAQKVKELSHFPALTMRNVDAQMEITPWSPNLGPKGELQQAWFRVLDIPADQRSIRTCAKAGGLVAKVVEIDEKTRFRADYVQMKIACRDVQKVPKVAEGTLGMFIHDFTFEREVQKEEAGRILSSGILVGDKAPPNNKLKFDTQGKSVQNTDGSGLDALGK